MPEASNTKAFDRYVYAESNPIKYMDPSGHYVVEDPDWWFVDEKNDVTINEPVDGGNDLCSTDNLVACYEEGTGPYWKDYEQVNPDELTALLNAVYDDFSNRVWYPPFLRYFADTPFWNGNGSWIDANNDGRVQEGEIDPNGYVNVCFDWDRCYPQIDVNYVAQGMWSAAKGQSLERALEISENWKHGKGFVGFWNTKSDPNYSMEGSNFWIIYGYNLYEQLDEFNK